MRRLSFCRKLYFKEFLFDAFFLIKCNFSLQYNIIFNHINLSSPLATPWGDINICARGLFCTKFNSELLLIEAFFVWCVFLAALSPKLNVIWHFSTISYFNLLIPLVPLREEIDICSHGLFCTKFNSEQLLFEAFLNVLRIFGSTEP